jgi:type IV pilus assembly protein PilY1
VSTPLFKTASGQPITTAVVGGNFNSAAGRRFMVAFGTGQKTPMTSTSPITYLKTAQSLYGVWDWNMNSWNALGSLQFAALDPSKTGLASSWVTPSDLQPNPVTIDATTGDHKASSNPTICFAGLTDCAPAPNNKFGWSIALPESNSQGNEQIVFNPQLNGTVFTVNSVLPANNVPTSCAVNTDKGWSYGFDFRTGGNVNFFVGHDGAIGTEQDATGTSALVANANGTYEVFQTVTNEHKDVEVNLPANNAAQRLTWIQLR